MTLGPFGRGAPSVLEVLPTGVANRVARTSDGISMVMGQVLTDDILANAVTQIAQSSISTSNPTLLAASGTQTIPEMSVTMTTQASGVILALMSINTRHSVAGTNITLGMNINGGGNSINRDIYHAVTGVGYVTTIFYLFTGLTAAAHTIEGRWSTGADTATAVVQQRSLILLELKR